jgi:hypothetical protein
MASEKDSLNQVLLKKLRKELSPYNPYNPYQKSSNGESDTLITLKGDAGPLRSLKDSQKKIDQKEPKKAALGELKARKVVEDILDLQISGHEIAIQEIQNKIASLIALEKEEALIQQDQNNVGSSSFNGEKNSKLIGQIFSQKPVKLTPRQEELKMLTDMIKDSKNKVEKLNIKKTEEEFKKSLTEIMKESEELDSYFRYEDNRKGKNRVFSLPQDSLLSLSEIFGQSDIRHEVVEIPANQLQQTYNSASQNQIPQEQVSVIVVNDPQNIYQQQYNQGMGQISQGQSWVAMVKSDRNNQSQPVLQNSSTQIQSAPKQSSFQSQLPAKPVVGSFTRDLGEQRAAVMVMARQK